jgi:hypothetical protein
MTISCKTPARRSKSQSITPANISSNTLQVRLRIRGRRRRAERRCRYREQILQCEATKGRRSRGGHR